MKFSNIIIGFILSFIFIWTISYFFIDTVMPKEWEPQLGRYTPAAGSQKRWRSEGWATSNMGKYEIYGIPDITKIDGKKIAIWGDSFIEANQVADQEKTAQVLTRICKANGIGDTTSFGIGRSGLNTVDYIFEIPKYEKFVNNIIAHYIVIAQTDDIIPEKQNPSHSLLVTKPELSLKEEKDLPPRNKELVYFVVKSELHFLWRFLVDVYQNFEIKFSLGLINNHSSDILTPTSSEQELTKAWSFLLNNLRDKTHLPIFFVYCPHVPHINNGTVKFNDKEKNIMNMFSKELANHDIGFIDLSNVFVNYYQETGNFPRGFINSKPGEGHFNKNGHKLIAETIFKSIKNKDQ